MMMMMMVRRRSDSSSSSRMMMGMNISGGQCRANKRETIRQRRGRPSSETNDFGWFHQCQNWSRESRFSLEEKILTTSAQAFYFVITNYISLLSGLPSTSSPSSQSLFFKPQSSKSSSQTFRKPEIPNRNLTETTFKGDSSTTSIFITCQDSRQNSVTI